MYLIDTCVFSELTKKEPSKRVKKWILDRDEELFYVSSLTFGEITKGIEKVTDSSRKRMLEQWVREYMFPRFSQKVLSIDSLVAKNWGILVAKAEKSGRILPTIDSLIAATALTHQLEIVTRNIKDFEGLKLSIINPWDPE